MHPTNRLAAVDAAIGLFGYATLVVFLVLSTLSSASAAEPPEQVTLQLKWSHQFQFAGYYAAVEKGFFADEGLDVADRVVQLVLGAGARPEHPLRSGAARAQRRVAEGWLLGAAAAAGTDFGTPWAEKITGRSSGHSDSSSTKTAPLSRRPSTTNLLCTISWRT